MHPKTRKDLTLREAIEETSTNAKFLNISIVLSRKK